MARPTEVTMFERILDSMPSAQPQITLESAIDYLHSIGWMQEHDRALTERKTGRWLPHKTKSGKDWWKCSECGAVTENASTAHYCYNCGAGMGGGHNGKTD